MIFAFLLSTLMGMGVGFLFPQVAEAFGILSAVVLVIGSFTVGAIAGRFG